MPARFQQGAQLGGIVKLAIVDKREFSAALGVKHRLSAVFGVDNGKTGMYQQRFAFRRDVIAVVIRPAAFQRGCHLARGDCGFGI